MICSKVVSKIIQMYPFQHKLIHAIFTVAGFILMIDNAVPAYSSVPPLIIHITNENKKPSSQLPGCTRFIGLQYDAGYSTQHRIYPGR
jgi:hypothetical protein